MGTVRDGRSNGQGVGDERVQIGPAPAQGIQTAQHVVADRDVHGAQLEQVELAGLAVVTGGQEASDARVRPESCSSASISSRAKACAPACAA